MYDVIFCCWYIGFMEIYGMFGGGKILGLGFLEELEVLIDG